jgi:hypothetical protein
MKARRTRNPPSAQQIAIYSITSSAPSMGAKAELRGTLQVTA